MAQRDWESGWDQCRDTGRVGGANAERLGGVSGANEERLGQGVEPMQGD